MFLEYHVFGQPKCIPKGYQESSGIDLIIELDLPFDYDLDRECQFLLRTRRKLLLLPLPLLRLQLLILVEKSLTVILAKFL